MSDLIRRRAAAVLMVALSAVAAVGAMVPTFADSYTPITGEGSSWASNAIQDWAAAVHSSGIQVNWAPNASVTALTNYANGNSDNFVASDVPYGLPGGQTPGVPGRGFGYVPDVAGGTALMYNLNVGGQRFTNLKLSGQAIAGIYQGTIKVWNDPKITATNPGVALPPLQITPVIRADQSGSTYQFSLYLAKTFPGQWHCGAFTDPSKCGPWASLKGQSGDSGVAGYVSQSGNVGSIGYVQYSYALQSGYPVAKVLNSSGYFVLPTASNVAVALLGAKVNMNKSDPNNYLTQDLSGVYTSGDQRSYPISSYSYFVLPTATTNGVSTTTGHTIAAFVNYALCSGQKDMPTLGYSPLPINLAQAGLDQVKKVPGAATASINIRNCNNPTFSTNGTNTLALNALYPDLCDKQGAAATCTYGKSSHGTSSSTAGQGDNNAAGNHTSGSSSGGGGSTVVGGGGGTGTSNGVPGTTTPGGSSSNGSNSGGGGSNVVTIQNPDGRYSCDHDTGQCTKLAATPSLVADHAGSTFAEWAIWVALASLAALVAVPPISVLIKRRAAR